MKKTHLLGSGTIIVTALGFVVLLVYLPEHLAGITQFTLEHPYLAPLIIVAWRVLAIVIPPIPGGILSFALIPVLGWFWSFIYAAIGILIGTSVAFFLARKFREPLVRRFVPLQKLHSWQGELSHRTQFLAFLTVRMTTGPVMDFISYIAGLSTLRFSRFLLATFIAILPDSLLYYVGDAAYKKFAEKSAYAGIGVLLILAIALYFLKDYDFGKKKGKKDVIN